MVVVDAVEPETVVVVDDVADVVPVWLEVDVVVVGVEIASGTFGEVEVVEDVVPRAEVVVDVVVLLVFGSYEDVVVVVPLEVLLVVGTSTNEEVVVVEDVGTPSIGPSVAVVVVDVDDVSSEEVVVVVVVDWVVVV